MKSIENRDGGDFSPTEIYCFGMIIMLAAILTMHIIPLFIFKDPGFELLGANEMIIFSIISCSVMVFVLILVIFIQLKFKSDFRRFLFFLFTAVTVGIIGMAIGIRWMKHADDINIDLSQSPRNELEDDVMNFMLAVFHICCESENVNVICGNPPNFPCVTDDVKFEEAKEVIGDSGSIVCGELGNVTDPRPSSPADFCSDGSSVFSEVALNKFFSLLKFTGKITLGTAATIFILVIIPIVIHIITLGYFKEEDKEEDQVIMENERVMKQN